jgi:hypothetical protein
MTQRQFAAALGFAFVAIWITLSFGWACLCLVGALAFYLAVLVLERAAGEAGFEGLASRFGREQPETPPARPSQSRVR